MSDSLKYKVAAKSVTGLGAIKFFEGDFVGEELFSKISFKGLVESGILIAPKAKKKVAEAKEYSKTKSKKKEDISKESLESD